MPAKFDDLYETVGQRIDKDFARSGWTYATTIAAPAGSPFIQPSADASGVAVDFKYEAPSTAKYAWTLSANVRPNPAKPAKGAPAVCPLLAQYFVGLKRGDVTYELGSDTTDAVAAAAFRATYETDALRARATTQLTDGFASAFEVTANIAENVRGGLVGAYDPSRSGLKTYTVAVAFDLLKCLRGSGAAYVVYDAADGFSVAAFAPLTPTRSVGIKVSPHAQSVKLALEARSPCGARVTGWVDPLQQLLALTAVRRINDRFRVALSASWSVKERDTLPKVGLSITSE